MLGQSLGGRSADTVSASSHDLSTERYVIEMVGK